MRFRHRSWNRRSRRSGVKIRWMGVGVLVFDALCEVRLHVDQIFEAEVAARILLGLDLGPRFEQNSCMALKIPMSEHPGNPPSSIKNLILVSS
jgi:hypothetical protein